jgi:lysophospholipase L1-like esterase
MFDVPPSRPPIRRARAAAVVLASAACIALLTAGCGLDGPGSGVAAIGPDSVAPGDVGPGLDGEMALEAPADQVADVTDVEQVAVSSVVPTPPAHIPQASFPSERPLPPDLPTTAAVVGDSLTLSAHDEIALYLDALGIDVIAIDGAENRRMTNGSDPDPGLEIVERIASVSEPELWVIALGTNDVGSSVRPDTYADSVEAILDAIPDGAAVVWVDAWIRDRRPDVETANEVLRSSLAARRDTAVADWFVHGDDRGLVTDDGVHLTGDGRYMFAATIASAIVDLFD